MATHLARYFRQRRLALGLRPGQVARRMGYQNPVGGANRICLFEQTGSMKPHLFAKLQAALGIDDTEVEEQIEKDRREHFENWLAWVNTYEPPKLVIRCIPGVFAERQLPEELQTLEEMERFASDFAKRYHKKVWLCPSRKLSIRFQEDGSKYEVLEASPDRTITPYMRLAGRKQQFLLGFQGGGLSGFKLLDQPRKPTAKEGDQ